MKDREGWEDRKGRNDMKDREGWEDRMGRKNRKDGFLILEICFEVIKRILQENKIFAC